MCSDVSVYEHHFEKHFATFSNDLNPCHLMDGKRNWLASSKPIAENDEESSYEEEEPANWNDVKDFAAFNLDEDELENAVRAEHFF